MHVAAVSEAVAAVQQQPLAEPGFARVLAQQLRAPAHAAAPTATVTLGQMLHSATAGTPAPWASVLSSTPWAAVAPPAPWAALAPASQVAPAVAAPNGSSAEFVKPVEGRWSSNFGPRIHPVTGKRSQHNGVDVAAPTGTPIAAAAPGVVRFAGARGGYGNLVILDHGNGTQTYYAHQDRIDVRAGQEIRQGEHIGTVGSTGRSTGPHLHFEVRRDGVPVDPAPLIGLR